MMSFLTAVSRRRIVLSSAPEARRRPSGEKATATTAAVWPRNEPVNSRAGVTAVLDGLGSDDMLVTRVASAALTLLTGGAGVDGLAFDPFEAFENFSLTRLSQVFGLEPSAILKLLIGSFNLIL
jgi:hypothetical protein